jgi:glycerol-3-phosphate acyltransferase PlsY
MKIVFICGPITTALARGDGSAGLLECARIVNEMEGSRMPTLGVIVAAYLIGSVSFAVVMSRLFGLPDPHSYGSGNPGATNVLRTGHKAAAALTLAGDGVKGFVAVWVANRLGASWGDASLATAGAALAVFLGHLYPLFHRFAGGKGVSTAAGIAFALSWQLGLALLVIWLVVALAFRMASLASLAAALVLPPLGFYFLGNWPEAWALIPIALLLFWRHRVNIRKIFAGEERKIGQKAR